MTLGRSRLLFLVAAAAGTVGGSCAGGDEGTPTGTGGTTAGQAGTSGSAGTTGAAGTT